MENQLEKKLQHEVGSSMSLHRIFRDAYADITPTVENQMETARMLAFYSNCSNGGELISRSARSQGCGLLWFALCHVPCQAGLDN